MTGSRWRDLLLFFFLLACLLLLAGYRFPVYFRVTVVEVNVSSVAPNGVRQVLSTPKQFRRMRLAIEPPTVVLDLLERRIRAYMRSSSLLSKAESGTRLEWLIRYAFNSTRLDSQRVLIFKTHEAH